MCMLQAGCDLSNDRPRVRTSHRQGLESLHKTAQQLTFEVFHREKIDVTVCVEVINPDDVRVRQHLRGLQLVPQCLDRFVARARHFMQNFDRHITLRRLQTGPITIQSLEHRALATASQTPLDHVAIAKYASDLEAGPGRIREARTAPPVYALMSHFAPGTARPP